MKHIIITIRYSLLMAKAKESWKIGKNIDVEGYKAILFNQERMNIRESIFKNITLRSLKNLFQRLPEDINLEVHMLTSDELPQKNKDFLSDIESTNSFIKVKYYSATGASFSKDLNEYLQINSKLSDMYASVRLDDDDALTTEWLEHIIKYLDPCYANMIISLSEGYALLASNAGEIKNISDFNWRFPSAGLTYIGKVNNTNLSIYQCGSHTVTDKRFPTIVDSTGKFFFRTYTSCNDSKDIFPNKGILDNYLSESNLKMFK